MLKVALIYHEGAGDGVERCVLVRTIEAQGHEVLSVATPEDDGHRVDETGADLVVAAGGDGTIARVARALAHTGVPMAVLPLGTANNIATSLGIRGTLDELVATWNSAKFRSFDLGLGTGPWGERRVVESLGGGLVTHVIAMMDRRPSAVGPRDGELARALRAYRDVLPQVASCRWNIRIDDEEVEGDFILVEVLNTPHIGPNFCLARDARPDDGWFSVVMADRSHRQALAAYFDDRLHDRPALLDLPVRLAQRVEIVNGDRLHLDDEVVGEAGVLGVTLTMEPGAVRLLASQ
ncbi:MAG: diacylglycerol kinase family protein [Vicinamibacterales bacterium]